MARRLDARVTAGPRRLPGGRRIGAIAGLGALGLVALVGVLGPHATAGAGSSAALAGSANSGFIPGFGGLDLVDLVAKCGVVIALLFVCLRVMGRMQSPGRRPGSLINVIESRPLAAKASLHLVAVGDRRLIVGLTPSGMVSLAEIDAAELAVAEAVAAGTRDSADGATERPALPSSVPGSPVRPPLPPLAGLGPLGRPVDALTGRLAAFLSGGAAR
jgi:flagellar biosynthetic protein FliO